MEICGYSCNDHLNEQDLYMHCLEMLARILSDQSCYGILLYSLIKPRLLTRGSLGYYHTVSVAFVS